MATTSREVLLIEDYDLQDELLEAIMYRTQEQECLQNAEKFVEEMSKKNYKPNNRVPQVSENYDGPRYTITDINNIRKEKALAGQLMSIKGYKRGIDSANQKIESLTWKAQKQWWEDHPVDITDFDPFAFLDN